MSDSPPKTPAPDVPAAPAPRVLRVVGVVRHWGDLPRDFDAGDLDLGPGERVLVETSGGAREARTATHVRPCAAERPLPRVIRRINDADDRLRAALAAKEAEAKRFCAERIRALNLDMKLVRVEVAPRGGRVLFYFAAEHRVDFRELVSTLARQYRCRIEMRQIGVRDAAKEIGGFGVCGQELCCTAYMTRFAPVSIRMAKDQGLALNPQKVSGQCGRLLCCLTYEQDTYRTLRTGLPKVGKAFNTVDGRKGRVRDVDVLRGRVRVWFDSGVEEFTREQLPKVLGTAPAATPEPDDHDDRDENEAPETSAAAPPPGEAPAPPPGPAAVKQGPPPRNWLKAGSGGRPRPSEGPRRDPRPPNRDGPRPPAPAGKPTAPGLDAPGGAPSSSGPMGAPRGRRSRGRR